MSKRLAFFLVFLCNSLAVSAAIIIYSYTGWDNFGERGFITLLSFIQLLAISWLSYKIFQVSGGTWRRSIWKESSALWGIISLGFLFLAFDEIFGIHESIDFLIHNIFNLQETNLTDRIDDIIVGLYGLAGVGILIANRNNLKTYKETLPLFVCGFFFLFVMVTLDILTNRNDILSLLFEHNQAAWLYVWLAVAEDALKVFAEAFFVLAFYSIYQKASSIYSDHRLS